MGLANLLAAEMTPESTAEAKELFHEVIAGFERDLRPDHPYTGMAKRHLSRLETQ